MVLMFAEDEAASSVRRICMEMTVKPQCTVLQTRCIPYLGLHNVGHFVLQHLFVWYTDLVSWVCSPPDGMWQAGRNTSKDHELLLPPSPFLPWPPTTKSYFHGMGKCFLRRVPVFPASEMCQETQPAARCYFREATSFRREGRTYEKKPDFPSKLPMTPPLTSHWMLDDGVWCTALTGGRSVIDANLALAVVFTTILSTHLHEVFISHWSSMIC